MSLFDKWFRKSAKDKQDAKIGIISVKDAMKLLGANYTISEKEMCGALKVSKKRQKDVLWNYSREVVEWCTEQNAHDEQWILIPRLSYTLNQVHQALPQEFCSASFWSDFHNSVDAGNSISTLINKKVEPAYRFINLKPKQVNAFLNAEDQKIFVPRQERAVAATLMQALIACKIVKSTRYMTDNVHWTHQSDWISDFSVQGNQSVVVQNTRHTTELSQQHAVVLGQYDENGLLFYTMPACLEKLISEAETSVVACSCIIPDMKS
jgi:hypothetical protein